MQASLLDARSDLILRLEGVKLALQSGYLMCADSLPLIILLAGCRYRQLGGLAKFSSCMVCLQEFGLRASSGWLWDGGSTAAADQSDMKIPDGAASVPHVSTDDVSSYSFTMH